MNSSVRNSLWSAYRFPLILFTSIVVGSILGLAMGERAAVFKPLGDIFINLMFTIVTPLVFFTISGSIAAMVDLKRLGKILGHMLLVFAVTGIVASVVMLAVVKISPPGVGASLGTSEKVELETFRTGEQIVKAITVSDFPNILSRRNMLPLIVFSVFFGFATACLGGRVKPVSDGLQLLGEIFLKMVHYIMYYAPIGLGAYFAALIGEFGPQLLSSYIDALVVYYPVCFVYFFIAFFFYAYYAGAMRGVRTYFREIITPCITALATQSSIATLPTNLAAAKRIGVPKDIREIVLPIGATMHMDGTCLSSIFKIAFLFGVFGHPFTGLGTYVSAVLVSVLGGVVMSGVPGGGLIGEMLIVSLYGFPPAAFPIVAMIGFLVDPPATMVNATGDTVAAMMVTRIVDGDGWMERVAEGTDEKSE